MPDHAGLQTAGPWDRSGDLGPAVGRRPSGCRWPARWRRAGSGCGIRAAAAERFSSSRRWTWRSVGEEAVVMAGSGESVTGSPEAGGEGSAGLDGIRVLRLCSAFEPAALSGRPAGYDAIGGMHTHTAELSRHLDRMGARQLVLTSRLDGPAGRTEFG